MRYAEDRVIALHLSLAYESTERTGQDRLPGHEAVVDGLGSRRELVNVTHVVDVESARGGASLMVVRHPMRGA